MTKKKASSAKIPRHPSVSIAPSYSAAQFSYVARTCASSSLIFLPPSGFLADSSARKSMHIQCERRVANLGSPTSSPHQTEHGARAADTRRHSSTSAQQTTCAVERLIHDLERSIVLVVLLHAALKLSVGRRRVEEPATHRVSQPSHPQSGKPHVQEQSMRDARTHARKHARK